MDAHTIAMAFNTANDKKLWKARANSRPQGGTDMVHFNSTNGMVTLSYNAVDGKFSVKFNKLHGAWGDYISAIARSLYTVLNTLKAAGLPFEAPPSPEGVEIIATKGAANVVYVRYVPPVNPVMPELRDTIGDSLEAWTDALGGNRQLATYARATAMHESGTPTDPAEFGVPDVKL